jgi:hypothetical protein
LVLPKALNGAASEPYAVATLLQPLLLCRSAERERSLQSHTTELAAACARRDAEVAALTTRAERAEAELRGERARCDAECSTLRAQLMVR